jgi:hypothetical protein
MNKFKSGDLVKFLNEVGGGIIKGFDRNGFAIVETEEGFEIPYAIQYLIHEFPFEEGKSEATEAKKTHDFFISSGLLPSIHLYYDERNGNFAAGFNNPLEKKLYVSIHQFEDKQWKNIMHFPSEKGVKIFQRAERFDDFCSLDKLLIQYFEIGDFKEENPSSLAFKIKIPADRFASFNDWPIDLASNAHCLDIPLKTIEKPISKPISQKTENAWLIQQQNVKGEYEIDLHAYAMPEFYQTDDISLILKRQLAFFDRCVNEVFLRKIRVLQIIHGTGEGILKSEIRKQLNQLGVEYFDAPLNIYGVGATTARFKH